MMERILKYAGIFENNYDHIFIPDLESKFQRDLADYLKQSGVNYVYQQRDVIRIIQDGSYQKMKAEEIVSLMLDFCEMIRLERGKNLTQYKSEFVVLIERFRQTSIQKSEQ